MTEFKETKLGMRVADAFASGEEAIAILVTEIIERVREDTLTVSDAVGTVQLFQDQRRFGEVLRLAEAVIAVEGFDQTPLELLRRYCQAAIELGSFTATQGVLERIEERIEEGHDAPAEQSEERAEILGLLGRIAKQRYVDFGNESDLRLAIKRYKAAFEESALVVDEPNREAAIWHGSNLLALLHLAERRNVHVGQPVPRIRKLREKVQSFIGPYDDTLNVWVRSSLIEVLLSHGDTASVKQATEHAEHLGTAAKATAFELGSLRRQLTEVWGCGVDHNVVQQLDGQTLTMGSAAVVVEAGATLEKLLGPERPIVHATLARAFEVAPAVCMITDVSGLAIGTGFLIPGTELHASLGKDLVVVTNNHVVSSKPFFGRSTAEPHEVRARFELIPGDDGQPLSIGGLEELWTDGGLDATILSIKAPERLSSLDPIQVADTLPRVSVEDPHVFVIGHPFGQQLSYSIRGNELIEVGKTFMHYLAPTDDGSSGSPVFNKAFDLVGLHHAGGFLMPSCKDESCKDESIRRPANEAITIAAIGDALAAHFGTGE